MKTTNFLPRPAGGRGAFCPSDGGDEASPLNREAAACGRGDFAVQQRIASDHYMAAEMNRQASMGWYGAYGGYMRPVVIVHH